MTSQRYRCVTEPLARAIWTCWRHESIALCRSLHVGSLQAQQQSPSRPSSLRWFSSQSNPLDLDDEALKFMKEAGIDLDEEMENIFRDTALPHDGEEIVEGSSATQSVGRNRHDDDSVMVISDENDEAYQRILKMNARQEAISSLKTDQHIQMAKNSIGLDKAPSKLTRTMNTVLKKHKHIFHTPVVKALKHAKDTNQFWMQQIRDGWFSTSRALYDHSRSLSYVSDEMVQSYSVCRRVLNDVSKRIPSLSVESVLDFGAGTGSGVWASASVFPDLQSVKCVEPAPYMRELGQALCEPLKSNDYANRSTQSCTESDTAHEGDGDGDGDGFAKPQVSWVETLASVDDTERFPIVMTSFVLREMPEAQKVQVLEKLWKHCSGALIIIDTATEEGSKSVLDARRHILKAFANDASVLAPCPHSGECGWGERFGALLKVSSRRKYLKRSKERNFCHFGQRIDLSSFPHSSMIHHRPKSGSRMRFQNEHLMPFTYTVLQKHSALRKLKATPVASSSDIAAEASQWSRLVKPPLFRGGHVIMDVCGTDKAITRHTVSKAKGRHDLSYRVARNSEWADLWPYAITNKSKSSN